MEQPKRRLSDLEKMMADAKTDTESIQDRKGRHHMPCEMVPVGYLSLDAEGRVVYVNREWCEIFGRSEEGVIGRWFGDFLLREDKDNFRKSYTDFRKEGRINDKELVVVCDNGVKKTISFNGRIEYDDSGNMVRSHCFTKDITAQKRVENALKRSEERFRILSESLPIGIFLTDAEGRVIYINNKLKEISGLDDEESMGFKWSQIVHPEDREQLKSARENVLNKSECSSTFRIVTPAGRQKLLALHSAPLISSGGKQIGRVGTIEDITVQRATEEKLLECELKYRQLFGTVPDAIVVFDAETHRFIDVNKAALNMYGYSRDEFLNMKHTDITMEKKQSDLSIRVTPGGIHEFIPLRHHRRKNGEEFPVEISAATFEYRGRPVLVGIIRDISPRIAIENSLRASEHRFHRIFEKSAIGMALVDRGGSFSVVNDSYCSILGYSENEILSMGLPEVAHPDDLSMIKDRFNGLHFGTCGHFQGEMRCIHRDGHTIWGVISIEVIWPEENENTQFILQYQDTTEKIRTLEAIKESEEMYRLIAENIPVVIYTAGPDRYTTTMFVSGSIKELTGHCQKSFINDPVLFFQIIHEDDKAYVKKKISGMIEQKGLLELEYRIRTKSGRIKWLRDLANPTYDDRGSITRIDGFVEDITNLKKVERMLHDSEQKYISIMDNIKIGIAVIDTQMRVVSANRQMREWFLDIDISKRQLCYEVFNHPPKSEVCSYCPAHKALKDGNVHEGVIQTPSRDGLKNFRIIASPLRNEKGEVTAVIETLEDITDKQKMEDEALKNEKLRSISILAGGIAHDFNNILASLLGNISLIKIRIKDDVDLAELIAEVELATDRAKRLTKQLNLFSKGKAPLQQTLNIADIIKESAEFTLHGSSISCEYDLHNDLHPVDIDVDQIDQVIHNLVLNAIQAMPEGGTIKIKGNKIILEKETQIQLPEGIYVRISIEDTGIGIPEKDLPLIFEPFFTAKSTGSGLGLAHCKTIINRHHGTLRVESNVGVGTTALIYLPVSREVPTQHQLEKVIPVSGYRVLVLDDEVSMRLMMKRMLERIDCEAECVADGIGAVNLYKEAMETGYPFDLVILDLTIRGGIGGRDTLLKLRKIDPGVKGIATSGYPLDPVMKDHKTYGFRDVIAKPFTIDELEKIVQRILGAEH